MRSPCGGPFPRLRQLVGTGPPSRVVTRLCTGFAIAGILAQGEIGLAAARFDPAAPVAAVSEWNGEPRPAGSRAAAPPTVAAYDPADEAWDGRFE